jgi:leader peptidase (prepilin peptidase)/N-methyltransferase
MLITLLVFFGLTLGSFMNVLIYRLPENLSIVYPGSFCPNCKSKIKFYDNIPVLSYLLLKSKCRICKTHIPIRYPLVELLFCIILVGLYLKFGLTTDFIFYSIFMFFITACGLTDLFTLLDKKFQTGIIPDKLTYTGMVVGLTLSYFLYMNLLSSFIGLIFGFLLLFVPNMIYKLIRKHDGIGGGDMKLMAMIGTYVNIYNILHILIFSLVFEILTGLFIIYKTKNKNFPIPFGPFIIIGNLIVIFFIL